MHLLTCVARGVLLSQQGHGVAFFTFPVVFTIFLCSSLEAANAPSSAPLSHT